MTFTSDPPVVGDITLIPGVDEKADLDAPAGSGGKLVIGQAPNITITETTVVADAAERLALDVQEGDIAIQTNTSQSFIFTGGPNLAPNWQVIDFDAVGAIAGEDIAPGDVTASGDMSMQNLTVAGAINGADTSAAAAGEALTSDGNGGFSFASSGGDLLSLAENFGTQSNLQQLIASPAEMQKVRQSPTADREFHLSDNYAATLDAFASINTGVSGGMDVIATSPAAMQEVATSQTAMQQVAASQTAMQEVAASPGAMREVIDTQTALDEVVNSQTAMQEVAASQTAMQQVAASQTAMQEVATSQTAMREIGKNVIAQDAIESSTTAINALNANTVSGSRVATFDLTEIPDLSDPDAAVYLQSIDHPKGSGIGCRNELIVNPDGPVIDFATSNNSETIEDFVTSVLHGSCTNGDSSFTQGSATYQYIPI
jgi:hypothetical protein